MRHISSYIYTEIYNYDYYCLDYITIQILLSKCTQDVLYLNFNIMYLRYTRSNISFSQSNICHQKKKKKRMCVHIEKQANSFITDNELLLLYS